MRVGGAGYGGPIACGGAHVRGLVADVALLGDIGRSQMGEGIPKPGAHCWLLRLSPFQATLRDEKRSTTHSLRVLPNSAGLQLCQLVKLMRN